MIYHLFSDRWLHDQDLFESPLGRDDPPELMERCRDYLTDRNTDEHAVIAISPTADLKTKAEIASAHIQTSVQGRSQTKDLLRRLALAQAAIDRLLAYVPARAKQLESSRLSALSEGLSRRAIELLPEANLLRIATAPDEDLDSMACHRMILVISVPNGFSPEKFVGVTRDLHKWLAAQTTEAEFCAIRLLVEPEVSAQL